MTKKIIQKIIIVATVTFFACFLVYLNYVPVAHACTSSNQNYCLLAPLPGVGDSSGAVDTKMGVGSYVNALIKIAIGLMSVLAVVMIVMGGIQYMTTTSGGEKNAGKERITNALFGLLLALSSYLLLRTINPKLVDLQVGLPAANLVVTDPFPTGEETFSSAPLDPSVNPSTVVSTSAGIFCPGSGGSAAIPAILASFLGHVTYRFGGGHPGSTAPPYNSDTSGYECPAGSGTLCKNSCPPGQMCLDCSAFVDTALKCAGIPSPGGGTGYIFNTGSAEKIDLRTFSDGMINGKLIKNGDLFGWTSTDNPGPSPKKDAVGHVLMYSNGELWDSSGGQAGRIPGNSIHHKPINTTYYLNYIHRVYHASS